ncbi:hypothetical protein ONE63_010437 [Megalurothrips usitatus]|uniref:Neurotransmitter-gated ion-channel ligand-binding domain-containing protein n=1 Tax=Megalurothrips usitatus TaxID=439358 RepID=A0AAV7XGY1_9NEOP|nr:hypothetical protein ONE63_010437 [Megalurothrips usitatus]
MDSPRVLASLLLAVLLQPAEWSRGVRAGSSQCSVPAARAPGTWGADVRRLRSDLMCDYDKLIVKPGTSVEINMYVYRLHLDVHRGMLQMLVDLNWSWYDSRLRWAPSSYSDIDELYFTDKEIWIPDLEALNSMQRDFETLRCLVTHEGNVTCNPVFNLQTTCGSSARRWPMDEHECVLELASRNHDSREYTLAVPENTTELMTSSDASSEWKIVNTSQEIREAQISRNFLFKRLEVRMTLRRNKYVHVMTVGVPTFVLPCLVLAQLWVDPRWPGRLLLGCVTVATLCLYLQYLSDVVPDDTEGKAPLIVLFYRDSMLVAVLVVVLTVALRGLSERTGPPPAWLTGGSSWVLRTVPRPIAAGMLLEDDDDDDMVEERAEAAVEVSASGQPDKVRWAGDDHPAAWRRIARLVDRAAFVVLSVTFAVLLFAESP